METLEKNLGFGFTARLDKTGTLTIVEEHSVDKRIADYDGSLLIDEPIITEQTMPAQAARALINFLLRQDCRDRIQFHKGQGHAPHKQ
jgi:hypothetical protein